MTRRIKKAVFPVGGLGTRFLPATKALPKEMLPIASKPLIQHAFEEAVKAGIEQFIFVTGRNKNIITNHFDCVYELERHLSDKDKDAALAQTRDWVPEPGNVCFTRQQHPLGLGHAVWCARNFVGDEPFAVLLADELFMSSRSDSVLKEMVQFYDEKRSNILAVSDVEHDQVSKYGIVKTEGDNGTTMKIIDMVEKPKPAEAPSNTSIVGRYILEPEIFEHLAKTQKGANGEIQLTDGIKSMLGTTETYGYRFAGKRMDCGNQLGFLEANIEFAMRDENYGEQAKKLVKHLAERQ
ncbi:MAG: UTP--glucose-1-phosphate uridylyltransferase GalU [Gammaproteobacteria bacterium]